MAEWLVGAVIGSALALLAFTLAQSFVVKPPPPMVGEKPLPPSPPPQTLPSPVSPERPEPTASPSPAPVPDRNEIRLPLPPVKTGTGPIQASQPPAPWACDANGVTAFMRAAQKGDLAQMEQLVAQGADVNQMDRWAHPALVYAIEEKSGPAVEWLLAHGAESDFNCCDGTQSPLLHALATGDLTVIEPVLRAERPLYWCQPAREALYAAIRAKDKALIRALLTYHQCAPTLEDSRQPLIGYALVWGDDELLFLLLECGADPNTPLASPVDKDFSQWIASKGIREYLETEPGMTLLMLAAALGRVDCVQTLLEYGAKRSAASAHYKMTAIDFASRYNASPEMLQVLLGKSPRPEDQRMWVNISIDRQRAVLYKNGQVAMVTPVSTGMPGFPTPTGRFVVTDKDKLRVSSIYHAYMPYFMRMSCRDFGMHAGVVPGYPASHGCIRLPYESAVRLYHEVEIGTLVTISP